MELVHSYQMSYSELQLESFDFYLAVHGQQSRSTFLTERMNLNGSTDKYLITHRGSIHDFLGKGKREKQYIDLGYKIFESENENSAVIHKVLNEIFKQACNKKRFNVLVDYSCMPKSWYAALINYFAKNELNTEQLSLHFSYTPPVYTKVLQPKKLNDITHLSISGKLKQNKKPVALVLGLGCEKEISQELIKRLNPDKLITFYADPAFDKMYVCDVLNNNNTILDNIDTSDIVRYAANNYEQIDTLLTSKCLDLRLNHKVVIAPTGPKTFALSCLLVSLKYPDVELWEIETEKSNKIFEAKAAGDPVIIKTVFKCENDEDDEF